LPADDLRHSLVHVLPLHLVVDVCVVVADGTPDAILAHLHSSFNSEVAIAVVGRTASRNYPDAWLGCALGCCAAWVTPHAYILRMITRMGTPAAVAALIDVRLAATARHLV